MNYIITGGTGFIGTHLTKRNNALADQYRQLAAQEKNVIFGGRLAEYKYYDMAPIVEKVLSLDIV